MIKITLKIFSAFLPLLMLSHTFAAQNNKPSKDEEALIYKAAGIKKTAMGWESKCSLVHIETYKDLNNDGRMDAIVRDGGTKCYGATGTGFYILTKQNNHTWTKILNSKGTPIILPTVGRHGWPDIAIADTSTCFPVYRWNGKSYAIDRYEDKGRACAKR